MSKGIFKSLKEEIKTEDILYIEGASIEELSNYAFISPLDISTPYSSAAAICMLLAILLFVVAGICSFIDLSLKGWDGLSWISLFSLTF